MNNTTQTVKLHKEARQIVAKAELLGLYVSIKCEEPMSFRIEITETETGGDWLNIFYRTDSGRPRRVGTSGCYTAHFDGGARKITPSTLSDILSDLYLFVRLAR